MTHAPRDIAAGVTAIIQQQAAAARGDTNLTDISPHRTLGDDLGLDGLDLLEILMRIEELFGVNMRDDILHLDMTVAEVFDMVMVSVRENEGN